METAQSEKEASLLSHKFEPADSPMPSYEQSIE